MWIAWAQPPPRPQPRLSLALPTVLPRLLFTPSEATLELFQRRSDGHHTHALGSRG